MTRTEIFGELEKIQEKITKSKKMAELKYSIDSYKLEIALVEYSRSMKEKNRIEYHFSKTQNDIYQQCLIGKVIDDCKKMGLIA